VLVALGADVEVDDLVDAAGGLRVGGLVLEVDDLDRTTRGEDDTADVVGVVRLADPQPLRCAYSSARS
jgi:hypothetical protein